MILDLLKGRFSARAFQDRPVPPAIVEEMLEAARLSPSGGNEQAWAFGVITDRDLIEKVADVSHENRTWMVRAPLLVVLCTRFPDAEPEVGTRDLRFPELTQQIRAVPKAVHNAVYMEEHQVKIPGTQMAMAALEHGVQCTWISHFDVYKLATLLKLPEGYLPSNVLAFGYPAGGDSAGREGPRRKRPLVDIVFYNTGEALLEA